MKTWHKQLGVFVLASVCAAAPAWADEDATSGPEDATATAEDAQAPPADATEAVDAGADVSPSDDATSTAGDGSALPGDASAATGDGDHDGDHAGDRHGGCTAGPVSGSPIALGLTGAILGWLVSRARKPAPVRVRK